jgi:hypothetical protein
MFDHWIFVCMLSILSCLGWLFGSMIVLDLYLVSCFGGRNMSWFICLFTQQLLHEVSELLNYYMPKCVQITVLLDDYITMLIQWISDDYHFMLIHNNRQPFFGSAVIFLVASLPYSLKLNHVASIPVFLWPMLSLQNCSELLLTTLIALNETKHWKSGFTFRFSFLITI